MNATRAMRVLAVVAGLAVVGACGQMSSASLIDQVGGVNQIRSLSDKFVNNLAGDSRTSKMLSNTDVGALKSKMSNQLCALMGGGCPASLSDAQITEAAKKVDAPTSRAVNESFSNAVGSMNASSVAKETLTKTLGSKMSGIVAGLL
jgi:hemoglobin